MTDLPPDFEHHFDRISGRPMFYDRDGMPITFREYVRLSSQEQFEYSRVAFTRLTEDVYVSTVWLGIDISAGIGPGPPLIFETMVFTRRDEPYEVSPGNLLTHEGGEQYRWPTFEMALRGHNDVVAELLGALTIDEPVEHHERTRE